MTDKNKKNAFSKIRVKDLFKSKMNERSKGGVYENRRKRKTDGHEKKEKHSYL